jgi:hypothetical protein
MIQTNQQLQTDQQLQMLQMQGTLKKQYFKQKTINQKIIELRINSK